MTVAELFDEVGLSPCRPVPWGTPVHEPSPGVYVVALVEEATLGCSVDAEFLAPNEQKRWRSDEPVIYIGQATRQTLAKRMSQFYRHKYGSTQSPFRRPSRQTVTQPASTTASV